MGREIGEAVPGPDDLEPGVVELAQRLVRGDGLASAARADERDGVRGQEPVDDLFDLGQPRARADLARTEPGAAQGRREAVALRRERDVLPGGAAVGRAHPVRDGREDLVGASGDVARPGGVRGDADGFPLARQRGDERVDDVGVRLGVADHEQCPRVRPPQPFQRGQRVQVEPAGIVREDPGQVGSGRVAVRLGHQPGRDVGAVPAPVRRFDSGVPS